MKSSNILQFIFGSMLFFYAFNLVHAESPLPMLQTTSDQVLSTLQKNKARLKQNPAIVFHAVEQYMVPHVDLDGMARSVLGKQAWLKANVNERKEFKQAFTKLVIRTYATPLAEYSNESVKFFPLRGSIEKQFIRVNSIIVRPGGRDIAVSYSLIAQNGRWKIYDLSIEGVSLLQSFKSQFAHVLQNSNMRDLIHEMQQRSKA